MNKNIELVVCDLDDTLIHKDLHLSSEICDMVSGLRCHGVQFTFATGRMPYRAQAFANDVNLTIPYIANNGSILYEKDHMAYSKLLCPAPLKNLIREYMHTVPDFTVIFSYPDRECPLIRTNWIEQRLHKYPGYDQTLGDTDDAWNQNVHKVYVLDDARTGAIDRLAIQLEAFRSDFSFFQYGSYSIEIVASGCSKASGLKKLLEYLKISPENVLAIGDHTNDIEIVQMAGIGAAVANADPKLKAVADYVTQRERADGVIEAVNKFVLHT